MIDIQYSKLMLQIECLIKKQKLNKDSADIVSINWARLANSCQIIQSYPKS